MAFVSQRAFGMFRNADTRQLLVRLDGNEDVQMGNTDTLKKLILAVDFGTTFSSVAYVRVTEALDETILGLADVRCIANYPKERPHAEGSWAFEPRQDVPTELWYPTEGPKRPVMEEDRMMAQQETESDPNLESWSDLAESSDEDVPRAAPLVGDCGPTSNEVRPFWGYEVQHQLRDSDIPKDDRGRIERFKLMLDEKEATSQIRQTLNPTLEALRKAKIIKSDTDVITEYFYQLFLHTKVRLQSWHDFSESIPIEFVLCVPAVWPHKACRIMQTAMGTAAVRAELGTSNGPPLSNLFIVSEPEAAAMCVLEEHQNEIRYGETIVVIDAGGGTVDATTYLSTFQSPSDSQKRRYINEALEALLHSKLKDEEYLIRENRTIKSIIESKIVEFENSSKRVLDVTDKNALLESIPIDGLRPNSARGLHADRVKFTRAELEHLFGKCLRGARDVLQGQLNAAKANEHSVTVSLDQSLATKIPRRTDISKVILIGGFGKSPSLQNYLRRQIAKERNFEGNRIEFFVSRASSTVVARGAVLRALNKKHGPRRVIMCSYGFLRAEPWDPDVWEAHKNVTSRIDKADGERYIYNTIDWLLQKGTLLDARKEICMPQKHTFRFHEKEFICREELYVSDEIQPSHYRKSHPMNKRAELAGAIEVNMTFLRDEGHIEPSRPSDWSAKKARAKYWAVEFDLWMIVEGRNLYYEARWPPSSAICQSPHEQVLKTGQICIAAAFKPGTA